MPLAVIDNFSLALTHGLLLLIAWRLLFRADLDREPRAKARKDAEQPSDFAPRPRRRGDRGA